MNPVIGESIQLVQSMYSKGVQSKDSRLTSRHIYSELLNARSTILQQQDTKGQKASKFIYQVLSCVELQKAVPTECPCVPTNGCLILRTKYQLPTPVTGLSDMLITSMTTMDGSEVINPTTFETVKYDAGKKYTSTQAGFYIRNQYAFITHKRELKGVTVNGLFEDPIQVKQFPSLCGVCAECECLDIMDYEFPVDRRTLRAIAQLATDRLIITFGQMKEDKTNNASDDIMMGNQMIHQPNDNTEQ